MRFEERAHGGRPRALVVCVCVARGRAPPLSVIVVVGGAAGGGSDFGRLFGLLGGRAFKDELRLAADLFGSHGNGVLALELALEQFFGERILDVVFQSTTQRTRAEIEVRALLDDELLGLVRKNQLEAAQMFRLSRGRVSQLRRELLESWQVFQGMDAAAGSI